jgi:hypothetical protein
VFSFLSLFVSNEYLQLQFDIFPKECECKRVKFGLAELTKVMKNSKFDETPFYFSVTIVDTVYMLASATERDRSRWLIFIKNLAVSENGIRTLPHA